MGRSACVCGWVALCVCVCTYVMKCVYDGVCSCLLDTLSVYGCTTCVSEKACVVRESVCVSVWFCSMRVFGICVAVFEFTRM